MNPNTARSWNLLSKLMVVPSLLLLILGVSFTLRTRTFLKTAESSTGTIVELVSRRGSEGRISFAPVFTFNDESGAKHRVLSSTSSNPPIGDVGDEIELFYDPDDPEHAVENRFFSLWGMGSIFGGLGGFFFLLSLGAMLFTKRKMMASQDSDTGKKWTMPIGVLMAGGALNLLACLVFAWRAQSFVNSAVSATGEVVELQERPGSTAAVLYSPVVEFVDGAGKSHRIKSGSASSHPFASVGDRVEVLYDPESPELARLNAFGNVWGVTLVFLGIGTCLLMTLLGWLMFIKLVARLKASDTP